MKMLYTNESKKPYLCSVDIVLQNDDLTADGQECFEKEKKECQAMTM